MTFDITKLRNSPKGQDNFWHIHSRDGKPKIIYCVDAPGDWPIHGRDEKGQAIGWTESGRFFTGNQESDHDLITAEDEKQKVPALTEDDLKTMVSCAAGMSVSHPHLGASIWLFKAVDEIRRLRTLSPAKTANPIVQEDELLRWEKCAVESSLNPPGFVPPHYLYKAINIIRQLQTPSQK